MVGASLSEPSNRARVPRPAEYLPSFTHRMRSPQRESKPDDDPDHLILIQCDRPNQIDSFTRSDRYAGALPLFSKHDRSMRMKAVLLTRKAVLIARKALLSDGRHMWPLNGSTGAAADAALVWTLGLGGPNRRPFRRSGPLYLGGGPPRSHTGPHERPL